MNTKRISAVVIMLLLALALFACGGGSSPTPQLKPLDPQGNWLFTLDDSVTANTLGFGGELFELNPPAITSNSMLPTGTCTGTVFVSGNVSGTDNVNLTVTMQPSGSSQTVTFNLTGTITPDQAQMSGTWSGGAGNTCGLNGSGTFTAQVLAPVTGNWTGTFTESSGAALDISVSLALTENTQQTSVNMGQVTGQVTVSNSTCFSPATLALDNTSAHVGEKLLVQTQPDSNGAVLVLFGTVTPTADQVTNAYLVVHGGSCDGQTYTGTLTR